MRGESVREDPRVEMCSTARFAKILTAGFKPAKHEDTDLSFQKRVALNARGFRFELRGPMLLHGCGSSGSGQQEQGQES